ncbi:hypothetical protein BDV95DRAFT_656685 [Massariosphaeria phaeospora]|uniref:Uncharacterized protein n=1 Tax=Massariosphaeria phaeospora TaxID=100035 RepID=A0A7C8IEG4_9PLEO|nr:hypothetical protein BDV95DRAFT_656685 [Massariosphaeria phaeospora]
MRLGRRRANCDQPQCKSSGRLPTFCPCTSLKPLGANFVESRLADNRGLSPRLSAADAGCVQGDDRRRASSIKVAMRSALSKRCLQTPPLYLAPSLLAAGELQSATGYGARADTTPGSGLWSVAKPVETQLARRPLESTGGLTDAQAPNKPGRRLRDCLCGLGSFRRLKDADDGKGEATTVRGAVLITPLRRSGTRQHRSRRPSLAIVQQREPRPWDLRGLLLEVVKWLGAGRRPLFSGSIR